MPVYVFIWEVPKPAHSLTGLLDVIENPFPPGSSLYDINISPLISYISRLTQNDIPSISAMRSFSSAGLAVRFRDASQQPVNPRSR
jgi:hypothetical protein